VRPVLAGIVAGARADLTPKQVREIRDAYAAHIAREEGELFPLAATIFDAPVLAEIGREMAERRGIEPGMPKLPTD
jgi:pyridoxamine 5'-phosphate oxidase